MADLAGTREPGPGSGRLLVEAGRVGLAARASHDLTPEVTQWPAQVTVHGSGDTSDSVTLSAGLNLGSLTVREGTGGATIEVTIEEIPNGSE